MEAPLARDERKGPRIMHLNRSLANATIATLAAENYSLKKRKSITSSRLIHMRSQERDLRVREAMIELLLERLHKQHGEVDTSAVYDEIERQARVEVDRRTPRKRHRRTTVVRTKSKRGKRVRRTRAKTVKVETEAS